MKKNNKEKIILAFYINIAGMSPQDASNYLDHLRRELKPSEDDNIIQYLLPVTTEPTRVECVYPKYVVGEEVDEGFGEVIDRLNKVVKKLEDEQ